MKQVREQLIQFASLIELELDFATEDVAFADRSKFLSLLKEIDHTTSSLIASFALGNVIKNGIPVAIIGKPNAGKSTLLNGLLNEDRAIVSEIAGTTRDTIEEVLHINGIVYRLIDTAGIREGSSDLIENIGIARSREKMNAADLVLYVYDDTTETDEDLANQIKSFNESDISFLLIANKTDKGNAANSISNAIRISASKREGLSELKKAIYDKTLGQEVSTDQTIITNVRHLQSLQQIRDSISNIRNGMEENLPGDLLAIEIRTCLYHLGDITGEVTSEDKLDFIFSKFCIGK